MKSIRIHQRESNPLTLSWYLGVWPYGAVILHAAYTMLLGNVVGPDYVNAPKRVKSMLGLKV